MVHRARESQRVTEINLNAPKSLSPMNAEWIYIAHYIITTIYISVIVMTPFLYHLVGANMALPKSVLHYLKVPFTTERNDS